MLNKLVSETEVMVLIYYLTDAFNATNWWRDVEVFWTWQWRHQLLEVRGKERGSRGRVPQRGPGADPRWVKLKQYANLKGTKPA